MASFDNKYPKNLDYAVVMKATTIDLQQAAAAYTLFTGAVQDVMIESLVIRFRTAAAGVGGFTGISIQTDDTVNQVIIPQAVGVLANITAQNQLAWTGAMIIKSGKKIQLTVYGAAADASTICDVYVKYRPIVVNGQLT